MYHHASAGSAKRNVFDAIPLMYKKRGVQYCMYVCECVRVCACVSVCRLLSASVRESMLQSVWVGMCSVDSVCMSVCENDYDI